MLSLEIMIETLVYMGGIMTTLKRIRNTLLIPNKEKKIIMQ